jgi:hypothetical protein
MKVLVGDDNAAFGQHLADSLDRAGYEVLLAAAGVAAWRLPRGEDEEIARRVRRSVNAVRLRRERLEIPNPTARPGACGSPRWTDNGRKGYVRGRPPGSTWGGGPCARKNGHSRDGITARAARRSDPSPRNI